MRTKLITQKAEDTLNHLVTVELTASHIYKQLSATADEQGYLGAQKWYEKQYSEETEHAQKVMDYINDRGGCVHLGALPSVTLDKCMLRDLLERGFKEEIKVEVEWKTAIKQFYGESDYNSVMLAQWFIAEQTDEIKNVTDLIAKYDSLCCKDSCEVAIAEIDRIMGSR